MPQNHRSRHSPRQTSHKSFLGATAACRQPPQITKASEPNCKVWASHIPSRGAHAPRGQQSCRVARLGSVAGTYKRCTKGWLDGRWKVPGRLFRASSQSKLQHSLPIYKVDLVHLHLELAIRGCAALVCVESYNTLHGKNIAHLTPSAWPSSRLILRSLRSLGRR